MSNWPPMPNLWWLAVVGVALVLLLWWVAG